MATTTGTETERKASKMMDDKEARDLSAEIETIRGDIQNLTNTVSRIANRQIGRAQNMAAEKAYEAEEAIRRNPLSAVAIAVGLGFLFGLITRR